MNLPDLTKKVGPLPVGAWVLIAAVALVAYRRMTAGSSDAGPVYDVPPVVDPYAGMASAPIAGGTGLPASGAASGSPQTNSEWVRVATAYLVTQAGMGDSYTIAQTLTRYTQGTDKPGEQERKVINAAQRFFGLPPEGVSMRAPDTPAAPTPVPTVLVIPGTIASPPERVNGTRDPMLGRRTYGPLPADRRVDNLAKDLYTSTRYANVLIYANNATWSKLTTGSTVRKKGEYIKW